MMPANPSVRPVYVAVSLIPLKWDTNKGCYTYDGVIKVPICRNVISGGVNYIPCTKLFTENTSNTWPGINKPPFTLCTNNGITLLPVTTNNNEYALVAPKGSEPGTAKVVINNSRGQSIFSGLVFEIVDDVTLSESWYDDSFNERVTKNRDDINYLNGQLYDLGTNTQTTFNNVAKGDYSVVTRTVNVPYDGDNGTAYESDYIHLVKSRVTNNTGGKTVLDVTLSYKTLEGAHRNDVYQVPIGAGDNSVVLDFVNGYLITIPDETGTPFMASVPARHSSHFDVSVTSLKVRGDGTAQAVTLAFYERRYDLPKG